MAKKTAKPTKTVAKKTSNMHASTPAQITEPATAPSTTPEMPMEEPTISEIQVKHGHKLFLGAWAYVLGLIVAIAAAVFNPTGLDYYTILVLATFGVIVGLMNITDEEVLLFLVASLAFMVSASSVRGALPDFPMVDTLMRAIIVFTGAGAFVVAFKALFKVAKNE